MVHQLHAIHGLAPRRAAVTDGSNGLVTVTIAAISGEQIAEFRIFGGDHLLRNITDIIERQCGYPPSAQQYLQDGGLVDAGSLEPKSQKLHLTLVVSPFDKAQALRTAALHGHEAAARMLLFRLAQNAEVRCMLVEADADDSDGETALHKAARGGHETLCRLMLDAVPEKEVRGMMLEATDGSDGTALHNAAFLGHEAVCRLLLDVAPDAEVRGMMLRALDGTGDTPLNDAALQGHDTVCRLLLDAAPDEVTRRIVMEAAGENSYTALHHAARRGRETVCRLLLDFAPNIEVRRTMLEATDKDGWTALDLAGNVATSFVLLEALESVGIHLDTAVKF